MELDKKITEQVRLRYLENINYKMRENAVTTNGIRKATNNRQRVLANPPIFSVDLETGDVANQKATGRCWMFAALNTFRHKLIHTYKLKDFELSQAYTFFWDKYEKSNWFLESILKTSDLDLTDRKVAFLLNTPQQDGGQWDMLVSIFEKYGVVPKSVYPETVSSENSRGLNHYLNKYLRRQAHVLREMVANNASEESILEARNGMMEDIYRMLSITLGTPPDRFDFEYRDSEKEYHRESGISPTEFYEKYVGLNLRDYVSIINSPTKDKPYGKTYTVELLGNVVGGHVVKYLNLPMEEVKALAHHQLENGESVWFGCDVGQMSDRETGVMDLGLYEVNEVFEMEFNLGKEKRLDYGESMMTHAMVLTGVDVVDGVIKRWKVENSWGDKVGKKGFFTATDRWMDEYTYQVVIHKDYLTKAQLDAFQQEAILLKPWDPMGALA